MVRMKQENSFSIDSLWLIEASSQVALDRMFRPSKCKYEI